MIQKLKCRLGSHRIEHKSYSHTNKDGSFITIEWKWCDACGRRIGSMRLYNGK